MHRITDTHPLFVKEESDKVWIFLGWRGKEVT